MTEELKKRTWHYIQKPVIYDIRCDKCDGENIEWSEWEDMIWCYDCQIDTKGTMGIFSGFIPWGISQVIGISFNRWNMVKQQIEYPRHVGNKIEYFPEPPENPDEAL